MQSRYDTIAAAKTWNGSLIPPNQELLIPINGIYTRWRFAKGSSAVDATEQTVFAPTTNGSAGKWTRIDPVIDLRLPWNFNTANDTVLFTTPTGFRLHVLDVIPEVVNALTGSDTGSIGISSSLTLSGAGGLALIDGLSGAGFAGELGTEINVPAINSLVATNTLLHNLIAAGYAAGSGYWHVICNLFQTT